MGLRKKEKWRAITFKASHNTAVQLYDYSTKESRVVWGPNLIMVNPHEEITILNLSGGAPKKERVKKVLALEMGPSTMNDLLVVETADNAQLYLKVTYNWHFEIDTDNRMFLISDFVGDACKNMASRIRGTVTSIEYKNFKDHY